MIFEIEIKMLNSLKIYYLKRISSIKESNSLKNYYLKRISKIEELIEKLSSDCEGNNILQYDYDEDGVVSIIDNTIMVMAITGKLDNDERYDAENLTFNGKSLDLNNDGNLDIIDVQTLSYLRNEEIAKLDAITSSYDSPGFSVKDYIENYYNTNGDFPTLEQVKEIYNNYVSAPEEIIIDEITYHKTQPENPGEGYELVTTEQNGVTYYAWIEAEPSNMINGHEYVEIGGVKWATMNLGASSITDIGLYYTWGDTQGYTAAQVGAGEGQKFFSWWDYKYSEGGTVSNAGTITKYNESDGLTTLQSSDDAVTAAWGGSWRMPTIEEFQALSTATTSAWTADYEGSGVAGLILTSKADSSKKLFFPAAGNCNLGSVLDVGSHGYYWSSSLLTSNKTYGSYFRFYNGLNYLSSYIRRSGSSVRGVCDR